MDYSDSICLTNFETSIISELGLALVMTEDVENACSSR
jgi:hypothetical protein